MVTSSLVISLSFLILRVCKSTHSIMRYHWQEGIMRQETTVLRNWIMPWPDNLLWYVQHFSLNPDNAVGLWYCRCSDSPGCGFWGSNICPMLSYYLRSSSFVTLFSDKFKSEVSFFLSLIYCIIFLDFCRFLENMEV